MTTRDPGNGSGGTAPTQRVGLKRARVDADGLDGILAEPAVRPAMWPATVPLVDRHAFADPPATPAPLPPPPDTPARRPPGADARTLRLVERHPTARVLLASALVALGLVVTVIAHRLSSDAADAPTVATTTATATAPTTAHTTADVDAAAPTAPQPPPAVQPPAKALVRVGDERRFPATFDFNDAAAHVTSARAVAQLADDLRRCARVVVTGHTCSLGSEETNAAVGLFRAQAAADVLVAAGLERARIDVATAGSSQPAARNASRRSNRRVTVACLGETVQE